MDVDGLDHPPLPTPWRQFPLQGPTYTNTVRVRMERRCRGLYVWWSANGNLHACVYAHLTWHNSSELPRCQIQGEGTVVSILSAGVDDITYVLST